MQELTHKRTKTSKHFDLGNGQNRCITTLHSQHYGEPGNFADIDTYLEAKSVQDSETGEEFTHRCIKAPFELHMNRYKQPLKFKDKANGNIILVRPIGASNVAGNKQDNVIYYPSVWPGLDVRRTVTPEGIKEDIIKVGNDIPDYIQFRIQGNAAPYLSQPYVMIDGQVIPFPYQVSGDIYTLNTIPLRDMPIGTVLDPSLEVQPAGADTYLKKGDPNTSPGTEIVLTVWPISNSMRALLKFDISSIAGATINSAIMSLYKFSSNTGRTLDCCRVTQTNWIEGTTTGNGASWNYYDGFNNNLWATAGGDYTETNKASAAIPAANNWHNFTVTTQAQYALDSVSGILHSLIKDQLEDGTSSKTEYRSSNYTTNTTLRPKLVTDYTAGATGGKYLIDGFKSPLFSSPLVR